MTGISEPIAGIIIALCCHQICRYEMYPNTEYLQSINMTKIEFERMCKMSSWATCSSSKRRGKEEKGTEEEEEEEHANNEEEENADETTYVCFSYEVIYFN